MQFDEMGNRSGKTLMLLPGTACDYQTNFATVLERLGEKYNLICVNYDGFDGSDQIFPDMITVTEKIEKYIKDKEIEDFLAHKKLNLTAAVDKEAAYRESFRVLKKGGTFCGCFYVQGGCKRTDWFIRHLYQPKGFFTPPYETEQSLRMRLSKLYKEAEVTMVEGMGCFCCRK